MTKLINTANKVLFVRSLERIIVKNGAILVEDYEAFYPDVVEMLRKGLLKVQRL